MCRYSLTQARFSYGFKVIRGSSNVSVGYYLERGLLSRGYLHGPEVGVNFNF
ncbi:hypothetical protein MWH06_05225 [Wolbachia pipientis]|nr:hypothetical protein MWH06_05225 [Wolbachia pipientis]